MSQLHAPTVMRQWQRQVIVSMLICLSAFAATLEGTPQIADWIEWISIWFGGCLVGLPCLLAMWAALSSPPLGSRLPLALGLAAILGLIGAWCQRQDPAQAEVTKSLEWLAQIVGGVAILAALLTVLRWRFGWQVHLTHEASQCSMAPSQFGIRRMFAWTAVVAIILALARWLDSRPIAGSEPSDWGSLIQESLFLAVVLALWLPAAVAAAGLILGCGNRRKFAGWMIVWTLLATSIGCGVLINGNNETTEAAVTIASFELGLFGVCAGCLLILRGCGYRLTRSVDVNDHLSGRFPRNRFALLLTAQLLVAVGLCWPAAEIAQIRRDAARYWEITQELKHSGVEIDNGQVALYLPANQPLSSATIRRLQEYSGFANVRHLDLLGRQTTDALLGEIAKLHDLEILSAEGSGISDEGLARVCELKRLQHLRLNRTRITDDGLAALRQLPLLESLDMSGTPIRTLKDLKIYIAGPHDAESPPVNQTQITDAGVARLCELKQLKILRLTESRLTDAGLAALCMLPNLEHLDLARTPITDAGLPALLDARKLLCLGLHGTRVSATGLAALNCHPTLHLIYLPNAANSKEAVLAFQRASPRAGWTLHEAMLFSGASGVRVARQP
jgi:hypothetical protein